MSDTLQMSRRTRNFETHCFNVLRIYDQNCLEYHMQNLFKFSQFVAKL
jgi:hypothetical protein